MAKTNKGLVEYAKAQLGKPYWYGTFGNTASESLYNSKNRQYPQYYSKGNYRTGFSHQYGQRVHDCVGLIKGYLWSDSPTAKPIYNAKQDVSANGMRSKCKENGEIATIPDIEGVLVFKNGHVGVYIGDGYVIEAMGHDEGVVRTKLASRPWTSWGKCPWIEYDEIKPEKTIDEIAREVINGKWDKGIERKKKLEAAGYNYIKVQNRVNELLTKKVQYFPQCKYKGNSIVSALNEIGVNSSFTNRKKIAAANGITAYVGTAKQNTTLLNKLKEGLLIKP